MLSETKLHGGSAHVSTGGPEHRPARIARLTRPIGALAHSDDHSKRFTQLDAGCVVRIAAIISRELVRVIGPDGQSYDVFAQDVVEDDEIGETDPPRQLAAAATNGF